jgi:glycine cleavage system H protein
MARRRRLCARVCARRRARRASVARRPTVARCRSGRPQDHEWIKIEGDIGTIGITNHAQEQLGDVVFVDLPEVGSKVEKDESMGAVESVKAASDIYSPVTGEVTEVNETLNDEPALVNTAAEVRALATCRDDAARATWSCVHEAEQAADERALSPTPCCAQADGWMTKVKLSSPDELDALMDADAYAAFCKE